VRRAPAYPRLRPDRDMVVSSGGNQPGSADVL